MEKVNTVLVALDLEAGSDAVLARAPQLAAVHGARLVALHVIEAEPLQSTAAHMKLTQGELRAQLERQAIAAMEARLVENDRMPPTEVRVAFGPPHEVITHTARERHADVVVIGPGKGQSLKDRILGSTADRVVRTSTAPVLVARKTSAGPYRRMAVAIDGSPLSERALAQARTLAPDAAVQLVQAVEIPLPFRQALLRAGTSQAEMDRYRAMLADKAREDLSAFKRHILAGKGPAVRILDGDPGPALVRFSKGSRIDLLALGSQGRGAAMQALLGSVARRVLGEAACDVLVATRRQ